MNTQENIKIKEGIKNTFDDVANEYDSNKQFVISAKKMVDLINISDKNINILDLSCGTGNITIELAKKFPNANIYGVDISREMLNVAKEKTKKLNITNIDYQLQDVENLEFENIKFDLVTCGYGLFFYPNMDKVYSDVCSILKSNGKFIFSTFQEHAFEPYSKIFLDMLETNYDIKFPNSIEKRLLNSKNEIKSFANQVIDITLEINCLDIKFAMSIDEWWKLLSSTGYKGLLTQLNENHSKFEKEYKEHLKSLSSDDNIDYNADSFISIVTY